MKITVFSRSNCAACVQLKRFLDYKKLSYVEKSVDNSDNLEELSKISSAMIVPQTLIENETQSQILLGYSPSQLMGALR